MSVLLVIFLAVQQWTTPFRVSPDTLPGIHPAVCIDDAGIVWVCWYNSNHLWTRYYFHESWSEVFLIDTAKCLVPEVTTSNVCKGTYEIPAWIVAWTDSSGYIRLSLCDMQPIAPRWNTTSPDLRIMGYTPAIAYDVDGKIWCAWTMSGPTSYYLVSYWDGNWSDPDTLKEFAPVEVTYTAGIATDHEGNIWVSYNADNTIWVQSSDGIDWSTPESIGTCFDYAYPTIYADSSTVWVAWFDGAATMGGNLCLAYFIDGYWSHPIEFPKSEGDTLGWQKHHQDICVDEEGRLWACWWRDAGITGENHMILADFYQDGWGRVDTVYFGLEPGGNPSIACDDGTVWIVWEHQSQTGSHIFASYSVFAEAQEITRQRAASLLFDIYPNPLSAATTIRYGLVKDSTVSLKVYNALGQEVKVLVDEFQRAGAYSLVWDSRDNAGRKVSCGTYFLKLEAGEHTATRKLSVIR